MVCSTSVKDGYWAVTHRSSAQIKFQVPSGSCWSCVYMLNSIGDSILSFLWFFHNLIFDSIFCRTSCVKSYSFRMRSIWFTVSHAADRSTNAAPVIMTLW